MGQKHYALGKLEDELKKLMPTIKAQAKKTRRLMSPAYTLHNSDDLVQEGVLCFYRAYELYANKPSKKINMDFGKYFFTALVNTFCGILAKSYRQVITEEKTPDDFFVKKLVDTVSPAKAFMLIEKLHGISPEARTYIKACLEPGPELRSEFTHKRILEPIRKALGLRCYEERILRKEIEQAFRG